MAGLYPDNQTVSIFGEEVVWPGLDPVTKKFTNGSFSDPQVKPSFIPADTVNLVLDNIGNLLSYLGFDPNNTDPEQLKKALHANRPIGELRFFDFEPTPLQLAKWRCLPENGQMIEISSYQDLCGLKYCGDDLNGDADWWYKTSDPEGLERDITGVYMRVIDRRGVFVRPAGQNSKYIMANGAPYDGGAVGEHILDALQNITGHIYSGSGEDIDPNQPGLFRDGSGVFFVNPSEPGKTIDISTMGSTAGYKYVYFDASRVVRAGPETAPASLSVFTGITF
jgi:hypothetical protein